MNATIQEGQTSLRALETAEKVVGVKQLRKALQSGRAGHVFLAENADPSLTADLRRQCSQQSVPCTWVATMADLGKACGIDVGAAVAAVLIASF